MRLKELKELPISKLSKMFRKENDFEYKCRIVKAIKILQNREMGN